MKYTQEELEAAAEKLQKERERTLKGNAWHEGYEAGHNKASEERYPIWHTVGVWFQGIAGVALMILVIFVFFSGIANAQVTVSASVPCSMANYQHSNCLPDEMRDYQIELCEYEN